MSLIYQADQEETQLRRIASSISETEKSLAWFKTEDVELVPEGTTCILSEGPFRGETCFVDGKDKTGTINPKNHLFSLRGEYLLHILTIREITILINSIHTCESYEGIIPLVKTWGPLRNYGSWGYSPHHVGCDSFQDWVTLVLRVKTLLDLLDGKDLSKYITRSKKGGWHGCSEFERDKVFFGCPESDLHSNVRNTIALFLEQGMEEVKINKRYFVLPQKQIVEWIQPADLYSFIWLALESTVLETPSTKDLRLRKCSYCQDWDLEEDDKRKMRQTRDKTFWYHDACKRRESRRKELEKKAVREGREYIIRPGARKKGVIGTKNDAP